VDLTQIQHAIVELPAEEQAALAAWIVDWNISIQGTAPVKKKVKELVSGVEIRDDRLKPGTIIRVTASLLSPKPIK
jgi:hypothetical protein